MFFPVLLLHHPPRLERSAVGGQRKLERELPLRLVRSAVLEPVANVQMRLPTHVPWQTDPLQTEVRLTLLVLVTTSAGL